MAIIIDITEYLNSKKKKDQATLKEVLSPVSVWESDEEKDRIMQERSERELKEREKEKAQYNM